MSIAPELNLVLETFPFSSDSARAKNPEQSSTLFSITQKLLLRHNDFLMVLFISPDALAPASTMLFTRATRSLSSE